ncbi:MAG TPA: cupin-like domain-containing protein [Burkholderiales bacterium]|nr:cupin-like domain-containing protein [Burkholderiales bacterium]
MDPQRLQNLSPERFATDFMARNRPVVVTDALDGWRLSERWTPDYLVEQFGDERVQVYNSYFDLKTVKKLGAYVRERFNRADGRPNPPYVRWYTKLRNVDFFWADAAFEKMRGYWSRPYFLPAGDYVLPYAPAPEAADPTVDYFPARGLFISERGARTGLHVDPWGSDAVLCQLYGRKSWRLYSPDQAPLLSSGDAVADLECIDTERFPRAAEARPTYEFVLEPGETVYVPHGWYHAVHSDTDCISLTWNFVHRTNAAAFAQWLERPHSKIDEDVVRFFFSRALGADASIQGVRGLVAKTFSCAPETASAAL